MSSYFYLNNNGVVSVMFRNTITAISEGLVSVPVLSSLIFFFNHRPYAVKFNVALTTLVCVACVWGGNKDAALLTKQILIGFAIISWLLFLSYEGWLWAAVKMHKRVGRGNSRAAKKLAEKVSSFKLSMLALHLNNHHHHKYSKSDIRAYFATVVLPKHGLPKKD